MGSTREVRTSLGSTTAPVVGPQPPQAPQAPLIFYLTKLGVEAQRRDKGVAFAAAVFALIFGGTENWHEGDHLKQAALSVGLDFDAMVTAIEAGNHSDEIERNHQGLESAGHWGVPTMVVRGEPFFGQDRIETLRWRLDQLGVERC